MKKKVLAAFMSVVICTAMFTACGQKAGDTDQGTVPVAENQTNQSTETAESSEADSSDDGMSQLEAIGDVDVDKGIFDVTLTIPKDFVGDTTQEKLDESVKEKGYKSATLNSDGSVTYVMTKAQHKEMMDGITESINNSLAEMAGSEDYPNITSVTANSDFTSFTITTKNAEPDMMESMSVLALYMYGGMYAIFNGETADNIHVDFVNADSREVISSANSEDMGNSD